MELLVGILLVGVLLLWLKVDKLDRAVRSASEDVTTLYEEASRLRGTVSALQYEASERRPEVAERRRVRAAPHAKASPRSSFPTWPGQRTWRSLRWASSAT